MTGRDAHARGRLADLVDRSRLSIAGSARRSAPADLAPTCMDAILRIEPIYDPTRLEGPQAPARMSVRRWHRFDGQRVRRRLGTVPIPDANVSRRVPYIAMAWHHDGPLPCDAFLKNRAPRRLRAARADGSLGGGLRRAVARRGPPTGGRRRAGADRVRLDRGPGLRCADAGLPLVERGVLGGTPRRDRARRGGASHAPKLARRHAGDHADGRAALTGLCRDRRRADQLACIQRADRMPEGVALRVLAS